MSQTQVSDQCALAVPRKISCEIGKRNFLVRELSKSNVSDNSWLEAILSKFYGAGNLDRGRRLKFNADKWLAQSERIEKSFQIQTAAGLETRAAALHIPIHAPGKAAHVIAPFAMSDGQLLIVPFCNCGEVSHFVVAPLQSIASKGCLDMCLLELSDVPAKFYL